MADGASGCAKPALGAGILVRAADEQSVGEKAYVGKVAAGRFPLVSYTPGVAAPVPSQSLDRLVRVADSELKANLSHYLDRAGNGEGFVIYREDQPIAELRPARKPRTIGWAKGEITVSPDFDDALPDDLQSLYEGR